MKKQLILLFALLVSTTTLWAWSGTGTEGDPILITSADDWNTLATNVNNGTNYSGVYFKQTANISVSTMVGSSTAKFSGIYNGDGHTITSSISNSNNYAAPFCFIDGATIKNFTVAGSVNGGIHCAGVVGGASGTNTISNVIATADVTCSSTHCGGILGHGGTSATTIEGCVFAGSISASGTSSVGALWGWSDGGCAPTITNCLEAGTSYSATNFNPVGMCSSWGTVTNTYYKNARKGNTSNARYDNLRGTLAYTITGATGVTVANAGSATTYSVSGITSYGTGIKYNDVLYGGSGDVVSLNLSGSRTGNYKTTTGTLSGSENPYTLTMAAANTVVDEDPWLYVAEGNVLKAYDGSTYTVDNPLMLTLTAPSNLLFDGAYKSATLSGSTAWEAAGLTLPTIYYDGITAAPSLLGSHTATITAGGQTATLNFEITADVTYKSFFDFTRGILEGTNYDVVAGTGRKEVELNNGSEGVWWDYTNKYAVFDGQAYLKVNNPLGNVDATTGFTITMDVYISSENNGTGTYYRASDGKSSQKRGWQRLFDLSDGTTANYFMLNAGASSTHGNANGHLFYEARYNNGDKSNQKLNVNTSSHYDEWITLTFVVFPGGKTTLYVNGAPVSYKEEDNITTTVVNHLSTYNLCYYGTSVWEDNGYADGFFFGKIRGYQTAEGALLPYWNGSSYQYLLTYKTNGGSSINAAFVSALPSELPTTTRDGYTFGGWYTDEALTTAATPGATITKNTFLYAKWTKYDVTAHQDPQHTSDYYTTFYDSYNQHQLPTGVVAYVGAVDGSTLTLTKVAEAGDILPVATPVILKATSSSFTLNISTETPVTITATNHLKGFDETTTISGSIYDGKVIYTLAAEDTNEDGVRELGFYKYIGSTLGANKAFLAPDAVTAARSFVFQLEDNLTGIAQVESGETKAEGYYNLSGQRVSKPTKGLYIVDKKKVIIK